MCGAVATERLHFPVHAMAGGDFLDSEGREHYHNPNGSGVGFRCGNGHRWVLPCSCWCGWTDEQPTRATQAGPSLDDQITAAIYEQALEDEQPWAVDTYERRAGGN